MLVYLFVCRLRKIEESLKRHDMYERHQRVDMQADHDDRPARVSRAIPTM